MPLTDRLAVLVVGAVVPPQELPPPTAGAKEIRDAAKEILRRPEFRPPAKSLYQRFLDFLGTQLGHLIDAIVSGGRGTVIAGIIVVALAGAAIYLVSRGLQLGRRVADPATDRTIVEPRRAPAAWDAEAGALEAAGDWRGALRARYRGLVARLARSGVVEEVPGRTTGEYRAQVSVTRPAIAPPFSEASELFEAAWYGGAETGPEETAALRALADRVDAGDGR